MQMTPCDPEGPPAGGQERAIPFAVAFKGLGGVVERATVELDRQSLRSPEAVDLELLDPHVGLGSRQAVLAHELEECDLELAAGPPQAGLPECEHLPHHGSPRPPWIAIQPVGQR